MLGPSGVGKSSLTKAMAEFLFGDERKGLYVLILVQVARGCVDPDPLSQDSDKHVGAEQQA